MKASVLLCAAVLGLAAAAHAQEAPDAPVWKKALARLQDSIERGAPWEERYQAYKEFRRVMEQLEDGEKEACRAAYSAVRPRIADGLRRGSVPLSGWLMGLFGALLLWGGLALCIWIAVRAERARKAAGEPSG